MSVMNTGNFAGTPFVERVTYYSIESNLNKLVFGFSSANLRMVAPREKKGRQPSFLRSTRLPLFSRLGGLKVRKSEVSDLAVRDRLLFLALHRLKMIVYPMLPQFYGVFLGFPLSYESNVIIDFKFSCVPCNSRMGSPSVFFMFSRDRDYITSV
jgi:hypothetical protein